MPTLKINIFAPDDEAWIIPPATVDPDAENRLRRQLEESGLTVLSLTPAHQGSFDVVAEGDIRAIYFFVAEVASGDEEYVIVNPAFKESTT